MTQTTSLARPRRTQAERREESRRRMLDAALELIAEHRSLRFTLAEVGERAGYSRGLPSQTFLTKTVLIEEVARHILVRSDAGTIPHGERGEGLEAVMTTARNLVLADAAQMQIHQAVQVLMSEGSAPGSPYRQAVAPLNQVSTGYLSKHLRIAAERGEIRSDIDFRAQAALLIAAVRGAVLHWQLEPERYDLTVLWSEFEANLKRSLAV